MPGVNQTGKTNPQDYNLGRGKVYFSSTVEQDAYGQFGSADGGESGPFRDLGNANEFSVTVETETLEHQSSLSGLKKIDKEVKLSQKVSLSLTLDEINFENLAVFLSGKEQVVDTSIPNILFTNSVAEGTPANTVCEITKPGQGRWFDLRETVVSDGVGQIFDIDPVARYGAGNNEDQVLVEFDPLGGIAYQPADIGDDYELDRVMGRIFFVPSSSGGAIKPSGANPVTVRITIYPHEGSPEPAMQSVKALTEGEISGVLKFISENPAYDDHQTMYIFHKVNLKAEGDFSLIGDEFTTMQFTGAAEAGDSATAADPKILTVVTHLGASQSSTN